jgi:hypothetical protein
VRVDLVLVATSKRESSVDSSVLTCEAIWLGVGTVGAFVSVSTVPPVIVRLAAAQTAVAFSAAVGPLALVSVRDAAPQTADATAVGSRTAVPVVCIVAPAPAVEECVSGTVNLTDVPLTIDAMV